jgi:hypothetical protein
VRSVLFAGGIFFALASPGYAASTVRIENKTNSTVEVWIDGTHACQPAAHTPCSSPQPEGHHRLHADRFDTHQIVELDIELTDQGYVWVPFPEEKQ